MFKTKIAGIGKAVGSSIKTSQELAVEMGVKDGWIEKATGVMSRHYIDQEKGETALTLGTQAALSAIRDANLDVSDIDCIIGASGTHLQAIPCDAALFQRELGLEQSGISCFDVDTTCYSFPLAVFIASNLVSSNLYKNILIISSDTPSPTLKKAEREVRVLFGDGAAACIVTKTPEGESSRVHHFKLNTYSEGADYTSVKGGGVLKHPNDPSTTLEDNIFHMEGKKVFKTAVRYLEGFFKELEEASKILISDYKFIVPHQTSKNGMEILRKYGFEKERIVNHLSDHGNCIAASIPMAFYDYIQSGEIKRGDMILLFGTSAGLSLGSLSITY
ncbi:3-oxoacyl-[acyl-carrier-protein] synthase III C-terminal domain-containing protein [Litchfieldia salsa]|uniref:3-oxoacyl-[acyl-carrier-protein] synthase-3 n=1 Tax=Litchfieldia salsa TaxID=930152 RepID=A0A1H0W653_9BACI|nr:3-oxoacyl-[acyl-carrier-protein] synthase III C-terminal domain-containing protein [Litchfieldia salsa]SDP85951.1 3-oxoacyl-[acyl-carrier-protein] synthase-3 [Litchfieldia salsa]